MGKTRKVLCQHACESCSEGSAKPMKQTQAVPLVKIMSDFIVTIKRIRLSRRCKENLGELFQPPCSSFDTGELVGSSLGYQRQSRKTFSIP